MRTGILRIEEESFLIKRRHVEARVKKNNCEENQHIVDFKIVMSNKNFCVKLEKITYFHY